MKKLLVTGVSGLLGLNLAFLAQDLYIITGVMRGASSVAIPDHTPFAVILADLTQPGEVWRVLDTAQPDLIINCAALTDVDRCEMMSDVAFRLNTWLPRELARATAYLRIPLIHISTDAVFDGSRGNYSESDEPHPINTYAHTKLDGERAVFEENPRALIARVNFYGWSWKGTRSISEYFFYNLSAGNPVKGFSDIVICPLLVNNTIEILLYMLDHGLSGLYHVTSPESLSKFTFGRMLARIFGFDENMISPISHKSAGLLVPRSPNLTMCSNKLFRDLDGAFYEQAAQEPAMRRYLELYHQDYPQTLRSLLAQNKATV